MNVARTSRRGLHNIIYTKRYVPLNTVFVRHASDNGVPRNEHIKIQLVHLINEEGKLEPLQPLQNILHTLKRKEQGVKLVSSDPPIVKIYKNTDEYFHAKAQKRAQFHSARAGQLKEHQMTWGVSPGDLRFKLKRAAEDLAKGYQVCISLAPKKNTPYPSPEERQAKVVEILAALKNVAKESKPHTLQGGVVSIFLQSI